MSPVVEINYNPPSPLPLSHKSMASLFGVDGDAAALWFKISAFSSPAFDLDAYISDLRRFVPFETLRAELSGHLGGLKNQLVELINRDYADFAFVENERYTHVTKEVRAELINSVWEKITSQYDILAREMVSVARKTEASLTTGVTKRRRRC